MKMTIIASGSGGNCALLEDGGTRLLIDAGLSAKRILQGISALGLQPHQINGILLTHEHGDHTCGLDVWCSQHRTPVFCNEQTFFAIRSERKKQVFLFENNEPFMAGGIEVKAFSVRHDAIDPVGFVFGQDRELGVVPDTGIVTDAMLDNLNSARRLYIESNYDEQMLLNDETRPLSLRQRIMAPDGHLSNINAALALRSLPNLQSAVLCHLSRHCNTPALAREAAVRGLEDAGRFDVTVEVAAS